MTTGSGLASPGARRVTRPLRRRAEPARADGRPQRAGDEGWNDAVLIWNGMVAVAPELRHNGPAKRGIRPRG
jgi:hypothetical protein